MMQVHQFDIIYTIMKINLKSGNPKKMFEPLFGSFKKRIKLLQTFVSNMTKNPLQDKLQAISEWKMNGHENDIMDSNESNLKLVNITSNRTTNKNIAKLNEKKTVFLGSFIKLWRA